MVCFSADKLLGGPQAGIAVGRAEAIERLRAHPLARAVRIDKLSLAALEATLRLHLDPRPRDRFPVAAMLAPDEEELEARARELAAWIGVAAGELAGDRTWCARAGQAGGGSLPETELAGPAVRVRPRGGGAEPARTPADGDAARDRAVRDDALLLDPRTILRRPAGPRRERRRCRAPGLTRQRPPMTAPLTIGTAGHIDHGKTVLVRALTGVDTDRLPQERERGISIELGFAQLELPSGRALSVVDVPGHERFVRTMVAGATGIDLFLLVVAADDGVDAADARAPARARGPGRAGRRGGGHQGRRGPGRGVAAAIAEVRDLLGGGPYAGAEVVPSAGLAAPGWIALGRRSSARPRHCQAAPRRRGRRACTSTARSRCTGSGTVVTGHAVGGELAAGRASPGRAERSRAPDPLASRSTASAVERAAAGQRVAA